MLYRQHATCRLVHSVYWTLPGLYIRYAVVYGKCLKAGKRKLQLPLMKQFIKAAGCIYFTQLSVLNPAERKQCPGNRETTLMTTFFLT